MTFLYNDAYKNVSGYVREVIMKLRNRTQMELSCNEMGTFDVEREQQLIHMKEQDRSK